MVESPTWTIKWKTLTTPGDLLVLLSTQLSPQAQIAVKAGNALLAGEGDRLQTISTFLASAASAASFLWFSPSRKRALRDAFPNRAADMRHVLGLADEEPRSLVKIRNDLTHIDERLEELLLANPKQPLIAWSDTTDVAKGTKVLMSFNPATGILHSLGEEIDVRELVAWFAELLKRLGKVWMPLWAKSEEIGKP